jgi:hypothetical protein
LAVTAFPGAPVLGCGSLSATRDVPVAWNVSP